MKDHQETTAFFDKFEHPDVTMDGQPRAKVSLEGLKTLWFNTGTLCNITCENCYIESSPKNDRLVYLGIADVVPYLDEAKGNHPELEEIGFTGGEPFMNPDMIDLAEAALSRGYRVLILTNAMRPMMRKSVRKGLERLQAEYGAKLILRISVDHWDEANHDKERGLGSFAKTIDGMEWLRDAGIRMAVAGRTMWGESDHEARKGFADLFRKHGFEIDASNPGELVLFPEMDLNADVPEITTACWGILNKAPSDVMCASSRMVVRRRGADHPVVLACTLLAYDAAFELGRTLKGANCEVALNHPHCAKFCVLGGASCSA